jgi:GTPase Era involved in 16S rRNA processing
MGGNESKFADSQEFEKTSFKLNILICGDYKIDLIRPYLENLKKYPENSNLSYIEKGNHKMISDWTYYFFKKDRSISNKTLDFLTKSIIKKPPDHKNLIIFYSSLKNYTYKDLIKFYDQQADSYHFNIIIITKNNEYFEMPTLKKMNPKLIRVLNEEEDIELLINIIEITSYCNELGDEIGFPKKFINEKLLKEDEKLMIKDPFTLNFLICGRPGSGKSSFINSILGKCKCLSGKGTSSLTSHIVKYIHELYPIAIFDTPGFEKKENIMVVQKLINDKNKALKEEKNQIHCVIYCMNQQRERTFSEDDYEFLLNLLNNNMKIFIITTHSKSKDSSKDFIEAVKINLLQKDEIKFAALINNIYPVELIGDEHYNKFGLKELFDGIYNAFKKEKFYDNITQYNEKNINTFFLKQISKTNAIERCTALSQRAKENFKLLASSMGISPSVKGTTMLSTAILKVISNIYNHHITTNDCLEIIETNQYTNELKKGDTAKRTVEKFFATLFYKNGPAAKEVDYLADILIKECNKEMNNDEHFYQYINNYKNAINNAIETLKEIREEY